MGSKNRYFGESGYRSQYFPHAKRALYPENIAHLKLMRKNCCEQFDSTN